MKDPLVPSARSKFIELLQNETRMSIGLILKTYNTLNLRQISTILGISEPSTHVHVKEMLEEGFIELDPSMAGHRGKYYQLAQDADEMLDVGEKEFEKNRPNPGTQEYYRTMSIALKALSIMTQRFGGYAANFMEERAEILADQFKKHQTDPKFSDTNPLSGNLSFINVANQEELDQIHKAFDNFLQTLTAIGQVNEDLKKEDIHETLLISGLIIPLFKLDPRT